jgi:SAM-dependent methyltransferase
MWLDYERQYREALKDPSFLLWREKGAKYKAGNILDVCKTISIRSAIEIGCGTGDVLRELMNLNFAGSYSGTDVSISALRAARGKLGDKFCGGFVSDATKLPLPDKTYSVAILSHVLEHLDQPARAAGEASRVADFVVAEVPTEKVATNWIRKTLLRREYASVAEAGHVQFWSLRSFVEFLQRDCGLEILALQRESISKEEDLFGKRGMAKAKPFIKHLLQALLPSFLRIWIFTTHTTVLCRPPSQKTAIAANDGPQVEHEAPVHAGDCVV